MFCLRLGFEVVGTARDTVSGRTSPLDRRELGAWLKEPHRFDAIVAWRTDRLSRGDQEDWTRIEHWATDNGKILIVANDATGIRYPARDDSDYWQWTALKRTAGAEWTAIRERNIRSQQRLTEAGSFQGRAPFGYRIVGERYKKRLEVDPLYRHVVVEVFEMIADGASLREAGLVLEAATGKKWAPELVRGMILNWAYAGRLERNGRKYADCPAIVSESLLTTAQAALRTRSRKPVGGRPTATPSLLVLTCGECGKKLYRTHGKYYHRNPEGCTLSVPVALADKAVRDVLARSTEPEMEEAVVRGKKASGERERLKRDRLDALERDDLELVASLTEAIKNVGEDEPDTTVLQPTGRTVGEMYAALSDAELRSHLRGWTITAFKDGRLRLASPWRRA